MEKERQEIQTMKRMIEEKAEKIIEKEVTKALEKALQDFFNR